MFHLWPCLILGSGGSSGCNLCLLLQPRFILALHSVLIPPHWESYCPFQLPGGPSSFREQGLVATRGPCCTHRVHEQCCLFRNISASSPGCPHNASLNTMSGRGISVPAPTCWGRMAHTAVTVFDGTAVRRLGGREPLAYLTHVFAKCLAIGRAQDFKLDVGI